MTFNEKANQVTGFSIRLCRKRSIKDQNCPVTSIITIVAALTIAKQWKTKLLELVGSVDSIRMFTVPLSLTHPH